MNVRIHHLITPPGHNYFGRHGMPGGAHPVTEQEEIERVAGKGIPGGRFFLWNDDCKGRLTRIDVAGSRTSAATPATKRFRPPPSIATWRFSVRT